MPHRRTPHLRQWPDSGQQPLRLRTAVSVARFWPAASKLLTQLSCRWARAEALLRYLYIYARNHTSRLNRRSVSVLLSSAPWIAAPWKTAGRKSALVSTENLHHGAASQPHHCRFRSRGSAVDGESIASRRAIHHPEPDPKTGERSHGGGARIPQLSVCHYRSICRSSFSLY